MVVEAHSDNTIESGNLRSERQLWYDQSRNTRLLGCSACMELEVCGGLNVGANVFDCMAACCGGKSDCTKVCRRKPLAYVQRVREVGGFDLENIPRVAKRCGPSLPTVVPLIFHGNCRSAPIKLDVVALPLSKMFDRRGGNPRFSTPGDLRLAFGLCAASKIVLTGTDQDLPIERWWGLQASGRRALIQALNRLDITLCTTPNYSLFIDTPRWDDLHSIKRIAIVQSEFQSEGMVSALHVNGRTDRDFERWAKFVAERDEITHLAYEFTTGTAWSGRQRQHAAWLASIAAYVSRPLSLVMRGGVDVAGSLTKSFDKITIVEATSFMKTMHRQLAIEMVGGSITWVPSPTALNEPLDRLFEENINCVNRVISAQLAVT